MPASVSSARLAAGSIAQDFTTTSRSALSLRARSSAMLSEVTSQLVCASGRSRSSSIGNHSAVWPPRSTSRISALLRGQLQLRVQGLRHVGGLRHRQHGHVVRRQVVEAPVRLRAPHLVGEDAAAAHHGDAAAAELHQQLQPLGQARVGVQAATEFDDPHQRRSLSNNAATATLGAHTSAHSRVPGVACGASRTTSRP